jgi:hypothetical protein
MATMKRSRLLTLLIVVVIGSSLPVCAAAQGSDAKTVLADRLDGAAAGVTYGSVAFVPSAPGFDRAADIGPGDYIKYTFPGWYVWPWSYDPTDKRGSVDLWVYPRQHPASLVHMQWYDAASPPSSGTIGTVTIDAAGHLRWDAWSSVVGGPPYAPPVSSGVIPLNTWTHIAVTWGVGGTKLYINGVLDGSSPDNFYPALNPVNYVYLNSWGATDLGYIDNFRISNVTLNQSYLSAYVRKRLTP